MADSSDAMADISDAAAADDVAAEPDVPLGPCTLEIFNVVKSSHALHGLRHGDYVRYRQYCTRRLHRIRKVVGLTHGKGRFIKRQLEPNMIRDAKALMLPLYMAERAWAYAMALKRENTAQESRPRFHLLSRLNKAAKWSQVLSQLCAARGDERTALEAEAYSGFMFGNMHLEREQWAPALTQLKKTRTICRELCRVSRSDQVHLYKTVAEEVEPSIRFCAYNLKRLGEEVAGDGDEEGMESGAMEELLDGGETGDILRGKLEAVLNESRARQAENLSELVVLGERVPITSEKVRHAPRAAVQPCTHADCTAPLECGHVAWRWSAVAEHTHTHGWMVVCALCSSLLISAVLPPLTRPSRVGTCVCARVSFRCASPSSHPSRRRRRSSR